MSKQKQRFKLFITCAMILLNIAAIFWASSPGNRALKNDVLNIVLVLPSLFVTVFFHELGHLIAGFLNGFRLLSFSIGPLTLVSTRKRWRLRLLNNSTLGYVQFAPENNPNMRRRLRFYYIAGPVASVISSVVFMGIFFAGYDISTHPATRALVENDPLFALRQSFAIWIMLSSFFVGFIISMIPINHNGVPSDGLQIETIGKMTPEQFKRSMILRMISSRQRPRHWSAEAIDYLIATAANPTDETIGAMLAYFKYLDSDDIPTAEVYEASMLQTAQQLDKAVLGTTLLEAAYFEVRWRGNKALGQQYIQTVGKDFADNHLNCRATAAVLYAEGEVEKANRCVDWALKEFEKRPFTGAIEFEIDSLQELRHHYSIFHK